MKILILLSVIFLVVSVVWYLVEPGFEPFITLLGGLISLISYFVVENRSKKNNNQSQKVSESSFGVQAGRDIHFGGEYDEKKK